MSFAHPIYLGADPDEAICERHGQMKKQLPMLKKEGDIHAAIDGVHLYVCPECCLTMSREAGMETFDEGNAVRGIMRSFVKEKWDDNLEKLFVNIGSGSMEEGNVYLHDDVEEDDIPDYLKEKDIWFAHDKGD